MVTNGQHYDWQTWTMGLVRAAIAGGSGAVSGLVITIGTGFKHQIISMGECFLIVGLMHMMIFLQTHPGPDKVVVETTHTTTTKEITETKHTGPGVDI